ncbi:YHS domain-containing (seleno)protein [Flavobacterium humi]|uniref:YHS domain-containing protein n=1 Tax=Flavobacterium humi TaxID=2562683 RepID=A0A4Z0LCS6_9FLAO|nr:YHS domain-containing (seleno)protein [Flavobacterium humi]TGD59663.1 YHS domain-containing protein [Flavobacterium humi]
MKKVLFIVLLFLSFSGFSQTTRKTAHLNLEGKVALQGYDPVAYFKQNKAVKGKKELASEYQGVVYYFSSKENAAAFLQHPATYEPQYGGWCAYAMGDYGKKVEINPETFKITDGKLYLFYNAYFNNTLKSWNKEEKKLKASADINWKKIQN